MHMASISLPCVSSREKMNQSLRSKTYIARERNFTASHTQGDPYANYEPYVSAKEEYIMYFHTCALCCVMVLTSREVMGCVW